MLKHGFGIPGALTLAIIASSLFGSIFLAAYMIVTQEIAVQPRDYFELPGAVLMFAAVSLILVIPCALLAGLPSALAIRQWELRGASSLALCLGAAILVQLPIPAIMNMAAGSSATPLFSTRSLIVTAPYSLSAVLVLWWTLSPRRADRPRSR